MSRGYAVFCVWADQHSGPISNAKVRREFGVSAQTATHYLRLRDRVAGATPDTGRDEAVLTHLLGVAEPQTCGQVARALGIDGAQAIHSLTALLRTRRCSRATHAKPYTYSASLIDSAIRVPSQPVTTGLALVPSLGVIAPPLRSVA